MGEKEQESKEDKRKANFERFFLERETIVEKEREKERRKTVDHPAYAFSWGSILTERSTRSA